MIVSRTLAPGEQAVYMLTGAGFSIVSASGFINLIEFLRQGKVVEDLIGSFSQGFYFKTPDGSVFDGVRFSSSSGGTFSVFIGHGVAGILEPDNARAVNVTNSSIDVDVQNAILNTSITNSALDVDIITSSVTVDPNEVGVTAANVGPNTSSADTGNTANLNVTSGNIVTIRVQGELYQAGSSNSYATQLDIYRQSTVIYSRKFAGLFPAVTELAPFSFDVELNSSAVSNTYYHASISSVAPSGTTVYIKNLRIKASL